MTHTVSRTCTVIEEPDSQEKSKNQSRELKDFRETNTYVLLGAPGSGKTTAFKCEAKCSGGFYVTARDFLTFDNKPEWHNTPLYIDALDEIRIGTTDVRTPLDRIRKKLDQMERPRFRLSCREADWFGANDRDRLKDVSCDGKITVLRIDSLSDKDIRKILRTDINVEDVDRFLCNANKNGITSLLSNPQNLQMLVAAVKSGAWPESQKETFELAYRTLIREFNPEYNIAIRDNTEIPRLMDISGKLCAVLLLAGYNGYTLPGHERNSQFLELNQIPGEDRAILHDCLKTRLFESPKNGQISPVHRQTSEFLAASYLANHITNNGLPLTRILALMTGDDGVVMSGLKGLTAWLATHSKPSRVEIITRMPLETALYGDFKDFSPSEKRTVLNGIKSEAKRNPWFITEVKMGPQLGLLVSPGTETIFKEILTDPSREESWQFYMIIVIEALAYGEPLPGIADLLLKLLRDSTWWFRIRHRAVDVFIRHRCDEEKSFADLKKLTVDINACRIPDSDYVLLGCLLTKLYPKSLSASKVMQYLRPSSSQNNGGDYEYFWTAHLPRESNPRQLALLLDDFFARYDHFCAEVGKNPTTMDFLSKVPLVLLSHFLESSKDNVELDRLFDWLGTAAWIDGLTTINRTSNEAQHIRDWLECHPEAQKTLLEMGLSRCVSQDECTDQSEFLVCMHKEVDRRHFVFNAKWPPDFGLWCLNHAVNAENQNAAIWFVRKVAECLHLRTSNEGLNQKVVAKQLVGHPHLEKTFIETLTEFKKPYADNECFAQDEKMKKSSDQLKRYDTVKQRAGELRENRAQPGFLHHLAKAYFGGFVDIQGDTPKERLKDYLGNEDGLINAVLEGFRRTINRNDLPTAEEIIRLHSNNRTHFLALPFRAGLEEIARSTSKGNIGLDTMQSRLAVAIHYTVLLWHRAKDTFNQTPIWFSHLVEFHPDVVAEVLVLYASAELRKGSTSVTGLYELAYFQNYSIIANLAALEILRAFPVRCTNSQLTTLNHLLWAASLHCERNHYLELIDKKLNYRSMNIAQRVFWFTAGARVSPNDYLQKLESYTDGSERRIRYLTEAVIGQYDFSRMSSQRLNVSILQFLIRVIGSSISPNIYEESGWVTLAIEAANYVRGFINQLATVPSQCATIALESLKSDRDMRSWQSYLVDAAYRQSMIRNEASFRYSTVDQILETFDNKAPANVADLAALTFEYICEISRITRDGNESGWRQYWNVDPYNKPESPKPENSCRDKLLWDLNNKLKPLGIDAQPEGHYADDKRCDIRVSYGGYNVPVEIKKSCNHDLFSAIETQLIAKYTRDPGAEGYGIYLVFWFGDTEGCRPIPLAGQRPNSAKELEVALKSTLSKEYLKIKIHVIDVARPDK